MQYVAFDLGNVLLEVDLNEFVKEWNWLADLKKDFLWYKDFNRVHPIDFLDDIQPHQDIGITTVEKSLKNRFPDIEYNDLLKAWNRVIKSNKLMFKFIKNLSQELYDKKFSNFPGLASIFSTENYIAFLSNIGFEHTSYLRQNQSELLQLGIQHFSCEVGARKPSKLYYQSFLMQYPQWYGAKFIDDREENLLAAQQFGFRTRKFELDKLMNLSSQDQKKELESLKDFILS